MIATSCFSTRCWAALIAVFSICLVTVGAVKHHDFKTCEQAGFCKRQQAYADAATSLGSSWVSPYILSWDSIAFKDGRLVGTILKLARDGGTIRLPLEVTFLASGVARVTVDEERRQKGEIELRHKSKARKQRYNEAGQWALVGGLDVSKTAVKEDEKDRVTRVRYGPSNSYVAVISHDPFRIEFVRDGETHVAVNGRGFFNIEHWRPKVEKKPETGDSNGGNATEDDSTWWEETFGGNTDSKPKGPESVGVDINFQDYDHVYGIPEHAAPLSLKETRGGGAGRYSQPYRMYNADVFEYEMDSPMTLYGSIPFMQAKRKGSTVGVLWLNAAETWVDVQKSKASTNPLSLGIGGRTSTQTHWFSESGILDVFVFLGPTPQDVVRSYTELTGTAQLPPYFSIAYHQCRWNYFTDQDVRDVDRKFDKHNIPYDAIWLDIEYTDDRKYFTWDPLNFKDPVGMQQQLDERDRKLVAIIDPHIKKTSNYFVVDELTSKGYAMLDKEGKIYEGWCWPGASHWVDCFNPAALKWWTGLYRYDRWKYTTPNLYLWNDMNEPSIFNGPEISAPRDNIHHGNWEHRDVHNLNGLTIIDGTYQGLIERKKGERRRPFVLTRAFFAGSQRFGAVWTGDNQAAWPHLAASIPMILSLNIAGFPNAGADVGGFFGNPSIELLTRWYQAGAFYPFFRAHAHIDTRRREPYLAEEPYKSMITSAIRLRYQLLPAWYTAFHEAHVDGSPILRPQYYVFPDDERGFAIDDQFYFGSTGLLVKPVVVEGATTTDVYLADDEPYYDYFDYTVHRGPGSKTLAAPLDKTPVLMQGGHVIPRRDRFRRSSGLMRWDPFTLVVALDKQGHAEGTLYVDDGDSFEYEEGAYIHRRFVVDLGGSSGSNSLRSEDFSQSSPSSSSSSSPSSSSKKAKAKAKATRSKHAAKYAQSMRAVRVEKIVIVGSLPAAWSSSTKRTVVVRDGDGYDDEDQSSPRRRHAEMLCHRAQDGRAAWAIIRDPKVGVATDWTIEFP